TSLEAVNKLKLQAGDTVAFKAGTAYTASAAGTGALNITASGTEKAPITFTTYGTGPAATIANSAAGYSDAINVANAKYVVIDGLTITGAAQAGVNVTKSASHITIRNVEASQVGEGVMLNGTDNLVTRSYFHDLKMIKNTANVYDDDYGAVGVMIGNSNNEVSYTKIVNAKAPSFDYGHGLSLVEVGGTASVEVSRRQVEGHRQPGAAQEAFDQPETTITARSG
ncbi:right-handed parallel beta-helix repeat-containing protein, partial [Methylobacterium sp. Leaf104]|uniref:right-handed parallel beta-helix repeat-containing protein n=1 Tax=Methylobacterium sp. Leaf104 TaxID=1736254 RepID=UPI0019109065